jgi:hypothetical protein
MRRDNLSSIACKINPDKARPEKEQRELQKFKRTIQDFKELPDFMEEATT